MDARNTFFLGCAIAFLGYSKYQGALIVFFTLWSNPRLLTRRPAWFAMGIAFLLLFPHLYWQWVHGFPTIEYQLLERNAGRYRPAYTLEYFVGQLLLPGPIIGIILLVAAWAYRPKNPVEKALKYSLAGFYLFFFISTLKGRVEANWTVPVLISLMVLSHQYLLDKARLRRWVVRLSFVTILLVMGVRAYMFIDTARSSFIDKDEIHGNKRWVAAIRQRAKGSPVVFINSYQRASKYWFYAGIPSLSLNTPTYRRNNFNFWPLEDSLLGKKIYLVGNYDTATLSEKFIDPVLENTGGKRIKYYFSFSRILIRPGKEIHSPASEEAFFRLTPYDTASIFVGVFRDDSLLAYFPTGWRLQDLPHTRSLLALPHDRLQAGGWSALPKGEYTLRYAISSCIPGQPTLNSRRILLYIH
jgi:hypothetical protein